MNWNDSFQKCKRNRNKAVTNTNDVSGENSEFPISEGFQDFERDLPYRDWGFKRRERDDVKKPGPRVDAKTLILMRNNNSVTG